MTMNCLLFFYAIDFFLPFLVVAIVDGGAWSCNRIPLHICILHTTQYVRYKFRSHKQKSSCTSYITLYVSYEFRSHHKHSDVMGAKCMVWYIKVIYLNLLFGQGIRKKGFVVL